SPSRRTIRTSHNGLKQLARKEPMKETSRQTTKPSRTVVLPTENQGRRNKSVSGQIFTSLAGCASSGRFGLAIHKPRHETMKRLIFLFALLLGLDSHGGFYDKLFVNWHNQSSASMWTAFYEQYNVNPQADAGGVSANYTLTSAPLVQFIYGSSPWTVTLSWYSDPALTQLRQQTTVTVNSPGPSGTNMSVDMYWTGMVIDDPSDGLPKTSNRLQKTARDPNCGMPGWEVSEPYVSLWLHDEPLGYQPALGQHVSFELAYKQ